MSDTQAKWTYAYEPGNPKWAEETAYIVIVDREKWIDDRMVEVSEEFNEICEEEFELKPHAEDSYVSVELSDSHSYMSNVYNKILEKFKVDSRFEEDDRLLTFNPDFPDY